ncbi:Uncharacterized conserved protein, DUF2141 family [Flavobacterium micromati]|jgi:uncharacterized protein (DUF2141 family)|uniref:Uncharacterized conserved protein, DUF2141 family n=1 Tax=Flavobacterium micromati TaxID=229205 RepID=A0A1M5PPZ2_9FLAO|nr:DUF2141 domain-containing protein [Flavobacterium micromati]SHH03844.1 Uncharacterized conserved protein, DUF2141 family [Flavobacterium micromati]
MKKLIVSTLLLTASFAFSQVTINVEVNGLKNNKGQVMIGIYNSEKTFLEKTFRGNVALIKNNKATATFANMPAGEYAISVFHDENSNGKLDVNFMGIPKEEYAASNGAKGFMGPPKYIDAMFKANENKMIVLKI